jgi:hypothetical protein
MILYDPPLVSNRREIYLYFNQMAFLQDFWQHTNIWNTWKIAQATGKELTFQKFLYVAKKPFLS